MAQTKPLEARAAPVHARGVRDARGGQLEQVVDAREPSAGDTAIDATIEASRSMSAAVDAMVEAPAPVPAAIVDVQTSLGPPASDAAVPDLRDQRGRLRRFAIAGAWATLAALAAATVTYGLARADLAAASYRSRGAWRFVIFFTGAAWVATYAAVRWWLDRKARAEDGPPRATARRRR